MSLWLAVRRNVVAVVSELIIIAALVWCGSFAKSPDPRIIADGAGYYDYLPSIFIRGDFVRKDFGKEESMRRFPEAWSNNTYVNIGEHRADKYFCGVAVLISPFFLVAQAVSDPGDTGYSPLFQSAVLVAAVFYVFIGLIFLRLLLRLYAVRTWAIIATQCFLVLGTSIFFYSAIQSTYSHVYSFAAITAFLYLGKMYFSTHSKRYFWWMAFVFAIVLLIRPVNVLALFTLPFIAGSWNGFVAGIKSAVTRPVVLVAGLLIAGIVFFIQPLVWYLQTGKFWIDTYASEHFDFTQPHIGAFLFGFRGGVFIYAPLLVMGLIGIVVMIRKFSVWTGVTLAAFLFLLTYLLSSWHDYAYGASFGSRVFVDYYALLAIPMAILLSSARWFNVALLPFGVFCMYCLVIQSWQYTHYVLHWGRMDYEKYWKVFLKTEEQYQRLLWKTEVYREWDIRETIRIDSVELGYLSCDTILHKRLPGEYFSKPGLLLIEFDNALAFDEEKFPLMDITVLDSASGAITVYNELPLFWFEDDDANGRGSYFIDVPSSADTTGTRYVLARIFTNEEPAKLKNIAFVIYKWKD